MSTRRRAVVLLVLGLVAVSACGGGGRSRDELYRELTTGADAMTDEQANCFIDGLRESGVPLDTYQNPKDEDQPKIRLVLATCAQKTSPGSSPGSSPAPPTT